MEYRILNFDGGMLNYAGILTSIDLIFLLQYSFVFRNFDYLNEKTWLLAVTLFYFLRFVLVEQVASFPGIKLPAKRTRGTDQPRLKEPGFPYCINDYLYIAGPKSEAKQVLIPDEWLAFPRVVLENLPAVGLKELPVGFYREEIIVENQCCYKGLLQRVGSPLRKQNKKG